MWGQLEEENYLRLKKELEENGDKTVNFNGIVGPLSLLIESMELVRNMCK